MNEQEDKLNRFSNHLIITLFAVFAFCSDSIFSSILISVKICYTLSLCSALVSMVYGFKSLMVSINFSLSKRHDKSTPNNQEIPIDTLKRIIAKTQKQYYWSLTAWTLLIVTIVVNLFQDYI